MQFLRPAHVCMALLAALDAAEGRRRKRKRDQTADAIGLIAKRQLLERAVNDDPEAERFEEWLLQCVESAHDSPDAAATGAMARVILEEWRLAHEMREFAQWLEHGAPSEDAAAR